MYLLPYKLGIAIVSWSCLSGAMHVLPRHTAMTWVHKLLIVSLLASSCWNAFMRLAASATIMAGAWSWTCYISFNGYLVLPPTIPAVPFPSISTALMIMAASFVLRRPFARFRLHMLRSTPTTLV